MKPEDIVAVTEAVRSADRAFERVGGSSRHWVRDCFLPEIERAGFALVRTTPQASETDQAGRPLNYVLGETDQAGRPL